MVVQSVACVGRWFQSLIVQRKNESLKMVVSQVGYLKLCEQDLVVQSVCGVDHTILCGMLSDHSTLLQMERHLPFSFPFLKSCFCR